MYLTKTNKWWLIFLLWVGFLVAENLFTLSFSWSLLQRINNQFLTFGTAVFYQLEKPFYLAQKSLHAVERVQDLEIKYSQAMANSGELEQLRLENQELKNILQNSDRPLTNSIISSTIISLSSPAIAVGEEDGVREGAPVVLRGNLLATISQLSRRSAHIDLLASQNSPVILAKTDSGSKGVIKGDGQRIILTEILPERKVAIGEKVLTLGQENLPPALLIGQVQENITRHSDSVQSFIVEPLVNFYESQMVEVYQ